MLEESMYKHDWKSIDLLIDAIFERQYYTNHGPELKLLEKELECYYPENEVLGLASYDIAFLISLVGLNASQRVVVPSLIEKSIFQALTFMKEELEVVSVDPLTGILDLESFEDNNAKNISTIIISNLFGNTIDYQDLYNQANKQNASVIILSRDGFGAPTSFKWKSDVTIIEIFDFSKSSMINGDVGAGLRTNNRVLAEKLRNIRSSYGARSKMKIPFTGNGRMSEIQAGLIRVSLSNLQERVTQNKNTFDKFLELLKKTEHCKVIQTNQRITTKPYYSKMILNIGKQNQINSQNLYSQLGFLKVPLKKAFEYDITILNQEENAIKFMNSTLVLPVYSIL